MTRPFEDPRVAGVAKPSRCHGRTPRGTRCTDSVSSSARRATPPWTIATVVFSNAASVIRRAAWRDQPFVLPAAEDADWAEKVAVQGWTIVYEAGAAVSHSHRESPRAHALRMIDINRVLDRDRTPRTRLRTVREAAALVVRDGRRIIALEGQTSMRKLAHLVELIRLAWYYVIDFSRSGTTAERRGAGSRS